MTRVNMHEARAHFSQLVERALAGEEIVRSGAHTELLGLMAREIELADDFDTLPDDMAEALGAREPSRAGSRQPSK